MAAHHSQALEEMETQSVRKHRFQSNGVRGGRWVSWGEILKSVELGVHLGTKCSNASA